MGFFTGALVWIKDSYYGQKQWLKLKCLNDGFDSYKLAAFHFTKHYLMDWSHMDILWVIVTNKRIYISDGLEVSKCLANFSFHGQF